MKKFSILHLLIIFFVIESLQAQDRRPEKINLASLIQPIDSTNIFINPGYYIWGGSAIQGEDGRYYLFYSRWPHGIRSNIDDSLNRIFNGFRGWQKFSEIALAVSNKPAGPYTHMKTILKGDFSADQWDRYTYHNPQINYFNGRYYLYFISNSFNDNMRFSRNLSTEQLHWYKYNCTQQIGVASSPDIAGFINGTFIKKVESIMKPDSIRTWEVTVNPSVTQGPDKRFYMMYKSRKPDLGHMTFWMAVAPTPEGPFVHYSEVSTSADMASEDPFLWYDKKLTRFYAIAKYFSNSGKLSTEFGSLILITSVDGKVWNTSTPYTVSPRSLVFKDGSRVNLSHLERPFLLFDHNGEIVCLFAAASVNSPFKNQTSDVNKLENTFNVHIPMTK